jgi:7-cyano-7-deazaguanine synthase
MKNAIILCSGGLDSVVCSHLVKKRLKYGNLIILFFDYGQRTLASERKCAKKCAKALNAKFIEINLDELKKISNSLINTNKKYKKLNIKDLKNTKEESEKYYVPCRNTIFLTYALALAESYFVKDKNKGKYDIFTGFKCEGKEAYPDTTIKYVQKINDLSKCACVGKFRIIAPLIKKDKEDIILLGQKLGVDFKDTHSCYINNTHCGTCLSCKLRQAGFYWAGIKDSTKYLQ